MEEAPTEELREEMRRREEMLQPLYTQVACEFADLHDRPGRMKAVGAVRDSLQWSTARASWRKGGIHMHFIDVCMYAACMYVCMCVCMQACLFVCMYLYVSLGVLLLAAEAPSARAAPRLRAALG